MLVVVVLAARRFSGIDYDYANARHQDSNKVQLAPAASASLRSVIMILVDQRSEP